MKKPNLWRRVGAVAMSLAMAASLMTSGVFAASESEATIDTTAPTSLTLYKYDITSAEEAGVWDTESYVSTGQEDLDGVNNVLSDYAVEGVEYTYVKVADLDILKENEDGTHHVIPLYGFHENVATSSKEVTEFLTALGLSTTDAYKTATDASGSRTWYFKSDVLIDALAAALQKNSTVVKTALETYVASNHGVPMPETDANGKTTVADMAQGLYLVVETSVPEYVVSTTDPFLVSLPMTTIDGDSWNYDVVLYPKNSTGNPNLEKTVREAKADTATHGGSTTDITDGYKHTATASDADVVDYQIISTLPTITSPRTALTTYTFVDQLSAGLKYVGGDVKIEWFKDAECTPDNLITTWTEGDGKFTVDRTDYSTSTGTTMTIAMSTTGFAEINSATTVYDTDTSLLRGYSDCTMRITYTAKVNSDATTVYGNDGNPNSVTLTWKRTNAKYEDTLTDDCHVFTYIVDLTKEFSDNNGDFANVKFLAHNTTDGYYVQATLNEAEGVWYVTGHTPNEAEATSLIPMSDGDNKGHIVLKGVENDTYILTETETDSGYKLLKEDISVVINSTESGVTCSGLHSHVLMVATAKVNGSDVVMNEDNGSANAAAPLTVTNTKGYDLPKTGGEGSGLIYLLGGIAMLAAVGVIAFTIKKKNAHA